jgi:hypothetical protein
MMDKGTTGAIRAPVIEFTAEGAEDAEEQRGLILINCTWDDESERKPVSC